MDIPTNYLVVNCILESHQNNKITQMMTQMNEQGFCSDHKSKCINL